MAHEPEIRLTALAHGGGCGCKLSPAVLRQVLAGMPQAALFPDLLVGTETGDDAAVYRLNDRQAIVATTDFFTPVVDDPGDFGRIAAANALSDVYAMGARPILALALVGMPLGKLPVCMTQQIVAGGAEICGKAGIPVAGGHSIDSPEPLYGLVALGLVDPARIMRNSGAQVGDALVLTKGLGIGVFGAALKQGGLDRAGYAAMLASATQLNRLGQDLPDLAGVHAVTDVTGFGLLGHALEMCRGSGLAATLHFEKVPILDGALALLESGFGTGAATRNWDSYCGEVQMAATLPVAAKGLLCDPQTSGGLLIAVAPNQAASVVRHAVQAGFVATAVIGHFTAGLPRIDVE